MIQKRPVSNMHNG